MKPAVFASGRGSNLKVLIARVAAGRLPARIVLVLSNNSGSGARPPSSTTCTGA